MIGLGTIINTACIIAGGIAGLLGGKLIKEKARETLNMVCGVSVLFLGTAGALEGMMSIEDGGLVSGHSMLIVLSLTIGSLIGEIIDLEHLFESLGEWLKVKSGSSEDNNFVNAFLTASLTVCIGAMAIVGSIKDGIYGDWSILAVKGILDLIIVMVMTSSMGKGAVFSAVPVFILQFGMTLAAQLIKPIMTDTAMAYLSMVGSILIFCVGINLVWGKKVRVANLLPALVLAAAAAFIPVSL